MGAIVSQGSTFPRTGRKAADTEERQGDLIKKKTGLEPSENVMFDL